MKLTETPFINFILNDHETLINSWSFDMKVMQLAKALFINDHETLLYTHGNLTKTFEILLHSCSFDMKFMNQAKACFKLKLVS